MAAGPRFKLATTIKNYVLSNRDYSGKVRELGFDRYVDPELIAEGLLAELGEKPFKNILDEALKKKEQRDEAREIFGV